MRRLTLILALLLAASPAVAGGGAQRMQRVGLTEKIVNGLVTSDFPSAVALLDIATGAQFCSGTLIGCRTVLTAAHCVCEGDGGDCQGEGATGLLRPSDVQVFSQHQGFIGVSRIAVPESYAFGVTGDVAVLELGDPVDGVAPSRINEIARPADGSPGTIVGFGLSRGDRDDAGIKREGRVEIAACTQVPASPHLCWRFTSPLGAAGTHSNTCVGDSGGPLFADLGAGPVVAGVTSGGLSDDCLPFDEAWDADVFFHRAWIRGEAGGDLDAPLCGPLPPAGGVEAPVFAASSQLRANAPRRFFVFDVPAGAKTLRVALNGAEGPLAAGNDFDLYLRASVPPTPADFDCASELTGTYEFCDVDSPAPGAWYVLVDRFTGEGRFQVTATVFGGDDTGTEGQCVPSSTTMCIDDEPGDRRFEVAVDYSTTAGGGSAGSGKAIPLSALDIHRGGLFWFFDVSNPELLIKILNGCGVNHKRWVFWSAGTSVGLVLRVTDTKTGGTKTYTSPDGTPAAPVTDTAAFDCDVVTSANAPLPR